MAEQSLQRRTILKLVGSSLVATSSGIAGAKSESTEFTLDEKHDLPHDISVINNSAESREVTIEILTTDESDSLYTRTFKLRGRNEPELPSVSSSRHFGDVTRAGEGRHLLRATAGEDTSETMIYLGEHGIPNFAVVSVYIHPSGELEVNHAIA